MRLILFLSVLFIAAVPEVGRAQVVTIVPSFAGGVQQFSGARDNSGLRVRATEDSPINGATSPSSFVQFLAFTDDEDLELISNAGVENFDGRQNVLGMVHFAIFSQPSFTLGAGQQLDSLGYSFRRADTRRINGTPTVPLNVISYAALFQNGRIFVHETSTPFGQPSAGIGVSVARTGLTARDFIFLNPDQFSQNPALHPDFTQPFHFGLGYFRSATSNFSLVTSLGTTSFSNARFDLNTSTISGAIPEPGTWAMMILGFGVVGGAMRGATRRRRLARAVA